MVVQWLSGIALVSSGTGLEIDWLSGYPLVIRCFEWLSKG